MRSRDLNNDIFILNYIILKKKMEKLGNLFEFFVTTGIKTMD